MIIIHYYDITYVNCEYHNQNDINERSPKQKKVDESDVSPLNNQGMKKTSMLNSTLDNIIIK